MSIFDKFKEAITDVANKAVDVAKQAADTLAHESVINAALELAKHAAELIAHAESVRAQLEADAAKAAEEAMK